MISDAWIRELLNEELAGRDLFLVELQIKPVNRIAVFIDSMKGVTLDECMAVSRFIESHLNRDEEDFELEVSSPGLDKPLRLPVQYVKNTGRQLDVVKTDGTKITGKLTGVMPEAIVLETETLVKEGPKGRKTKVVQPVEIKFEEIKAAKVVISLKK